MCALYPLVLSACLTAPRHAAPTLHTAAGDGAGRAESTTSRSAPVFVSPYTYEHFIRAELARAHGDLRGALEGYRRALAGADEDVLVIARLALTLDALGDTEAALDALRHGDEIDPESEAIWLARGEIAERHGETTEAIAAYERAQRHAPQSADPPLALARVLADVPERARDVLASFVQRHDRWHPRRLLVELTLALQAKDLTAALAALETLRAIATPTQDQLEAVARLALEQQRTWVARDVLGSPSARMLDRRLWLSVLIAARDFDGARLVLAMSTPEQVGGLAQLARAYLAIGDREQALSLAQLAYAREPLTANAVVLLEAMDAQALAHEVVVHGVTPAQ